MSAYQYCSIDLEFTGFDPQTEQILEIGFAFFDIKNGEIVIGEQWSQIFRPSIEVHPKILGLTGITQDEIDSAPEVAEFREFLSEKLSNVILVAHNPVLDVKFLEQAGVQLSGRVIDTLELVQFILPTYHSYNLENLMHYFGILHEGSHRALRDSLSTISLLEKLLTIYAGFPLELKAELNKIFAQGQFEWIALLEQSISPQQIVVNDLLAIDGVAKDKLSLNDQLLIDPTHHLHEARMAYNLQGHSQASLQVMHNKQEVLRLWRAGLVEGVFESKDLFHQEAFRQFLKTATTSEELRFCLKILVWQYTNWQTKTVLDLNLSFFGGQFKAFIVYGEYVPALQQVAACDYQTFLQLADSKLETHRELYICDVQRFERFLTFGSRERLTWYNFSFVVKSIYNPETGFGKEQFRNQVTELLSALDLFFGLVQIMLRQSTKQTDYVALADLEVLQPIYYRRLHSAASNLAKRLHQLGQAAQQERLGVLADELNRFFEPEENFVKWIELSEENVSLHSQPVRIDSIAQRYFKHYASVKLSETVSNSALLFYLVERLGFSTEILKNIKNIPKFKLETFNINKSELALEIKRLTAPLVVIFPSPATVKSFYKEFHQDLRANFHLFGQDYSGSGNKIFRNFRIFENSLLLATSQFINRQRYVAPSRTILYLEPPIVDVEQPYYQALLAEYKEQYENLSEILSSGELFLNIKQLSGEHAPKVLMLSAPGETKE